MAKKRCTSCLLVPFVFVVCVVGLFFTVTDPTSWPENNICLSATDMKTISPVSTIWCESLSMSSNHDFMVYNVHRNVKINPSKLTKHTVDVSTRLSKGSVSHLRLRYFLLKGSVISAAACASRYQTYLYILRDTVDESCLRTPPMRTLESSEYDSDGDSEEKYDRLRPSVGYEIYSIDRLQMLQKNCPSAVRFQEVPYVNTDDGELDCREAELQPVSFNVTSSGNYIIMMANHNRGISYMNIRVILDRTTFDLTEAETDRHFCRGDTTCSIPLAFASREITVVAVPYESNAGQNTITVKSQCRPRVAVFALITVFFPVILFTTISFIVRLDKKRARATPSSNTSPRNLNVCENFMFPLLVEDHQNARYHDEFTSESDTSSIASVPMPTSQANVAPPSYDTLYGLPPPYNSLKPQETNTVH